MNVVLYMIISAFVLMMIVAIIMVIIIVYALSFISNNCEYYLSSSWVDQGN